MSTKGLKNREFSVFQILVLCGTRDQKHTQRICDYLSLAPNTIATWASRGVPVVYWDHILRLSGLELHDLITAQAHLTKTGYAQLLAAYNQQRSREPVDTEEA